MSIGFYELYSQSFQVMIGDQDIQLPSGYLKEDSNKFRIIDYVEDFHFLSFLPLFLSLGRGYLQSSSYSFHARVGFGEDLF